MKAPEMRGHGLNAVEQAVMDRHDRDEQPDIIAAALEMPLDRVRRIVDRYRFSVVNPFEADARRGSAKLLQSLQALQAREAA